MHYRKIIDLKNDASSTCYYQKNSKIENRIEKDINYFKQTDHDNCDKINIALQRTLK